MRQERIILLLVIVMVVLSILLITGVGYAVETDNTLKISDNALLSPEQTDFKIAFTGEPTYTGKGVATLKLTGPTTATMNITGLDVIGDSVTATFTIANKSNYIYADIDAKVTNTNTEYFNVTSTLSESTLEPITGKATIKITVELIKLPIDNDENATICTNLVANPRT